MRTLKVFLTSLIVASALAGFSADAGRQYATITDFYDENGNIVGTEVIPCQGPPTMVGVMTQIATVQQFPCS